MNKKIVCHNLKNEKFEVDSERLKFRPSIYGVLIKDGKVLLSKQWNGYDFPGGGIEIYETLEEALRREFREETGLEIEPVEVIHCETSFYHPNHSKRHGQEYWNCPLMYFLVQEIGGQISITELDEEEKEYVALPEWIDVGELENLKFKNSVDSSTIIKRALDRQKRTFLF